MSQRAVYTGLLMWTLAPAVVAAPKKVSFSQPPRSVDAYDFVEVTVNGLTRATNDVGIVTLPDGRHMAVAIFVADSTANVTVRENVIARITRAAWDHWAQKSQ